MYKNDGRDFLLEIKWPGAIFIEIDYHNKIF